MSFGRLYAPDERDKNFRMSAIIPKESVRKYRYWWSNGAWLNQGNQPHCVAYGLLHWLEDGPITHPPYGPNSELIVNPTWLYREAQKIDEWSGEDYEGTSVRAGCKVLVKGSLIDKYYWANSIDEINLALLETGPVTVGTSWFRGMSNPDKNGFIEPSGICQGGHCYVLNGINVDRGLYRIKNSWGRVWGKRGFAYIKIDHFEVLLNDYGEVCLATEVG